jgi:quinolinate synthase
MDVFEKIQRLKKQRNAVILAHNYQLPEVQDIADFHGDSLGLSVEASKTKADVIVFCGVSFMAETAKIISPNKTVLIPEAAAGCPMADMITAQQLLALKNEHPSAKVMCYVNSSAAVKAESDLCCTSANAVDIAAKAFAPDEEVIFVPDKYLGGYTASQLGREFILWQGYCPTHARILPEYVSRVKRDHPAAEVLVHPECNGLVAAMADHVLSTGGMIRYVAGSSSKEFIIGTEVEMVYRLQKDNPDKRFYPATTLAVCPNMKKCTLDKVLSALERMEHEVTVEPVIADRARRSIERMLEYSRPAAGNRSVKA